MDPFPLAHVFKFLAILESFALIFFSLLPASLVPATGLAPPAWPIEHFLAYFAYGILLSGAFIAKSKMTLLTALIIGAGMGLLTETIQLFVPTRFFDISDWLADLAGVAGGAASVPGVLGGGRRKAQGALPVRSQRKVRSQAGAHVGGGAHLGSAPR